MVQDPQLMSELKRFRERLAHALPGGVELVTLFGSRATGRARDDSDVDLLVVSEAFRGLSFLRRAPLVRREWGLRYAVDILCYTPAKFRELQSQVSIVREAIAEGIAV